MGNIHHGVTNILKGYAKAREGKVDNIGYNISFLNSVSQDTFDNRTNVHLVIELVQDPNVLCFVRGNNYELGTLNGGLLRVNSVILDFINYLVIAGATHSEFRTVPYTNELRNLKYSGNHKEILQNLRLTDTLLAEDNFGSYSELVSFITDALYEVSPVYYLAYNKTGKYLDLFDEESFNSLDLTKFIKLSDVNSLFKSIYKTVPNYEASNPKRVFKHLSLIDYSFNQFLK